MNITLPTFLARLLAPALGFGGLIIVGLTTSWWAAFGLFLCFTATEVQIDS